MTEPLTDQILAAQGRLSKLLLRSDEPAEELVAQVIEEFITSLAELASSAELLRINNEELSAAREEIETERKRYRDLFDRAPDGYLVTDPDGVIREVNHAAAAMLGRAREELTGLPLSGLVDERDRDGFLGALAACRRGEPPREIEVRLLRSQAVPFDAALHVDPDLDADGALAGLRWLVIDATQRLRSLAELRRRDTLLEATTAAAGLLLRAPRWEDVIDEVLRRLAQAARADRSYIARIRRGPGDVLVAGERFQWTAAPVASKGSRAAPEEIPLDAELFGPHLQALAEGREVRVARSELPEPAAAVMDVFGIRSALVVPVFVQGEWWGLIGFDDPVKERRWFGPEVEALRTAAEVIGAAIHRSEIEDTLATSEEHFRMLAEHAQDVVYRYRIRPTRAFEYVSPAVTAIHGYTPQEHYDNPDIGFKIVHPDDVRILLSALAPTVRSLGDPVVIRWIHRDGHVVWTEHRNVPICDADGTVVALEGIAREITDRKVAENELLQALDRERRLASELQALDEAKTSIVEAVSHDLRGPLTSLLGFAMTLQSRFEDLTAEEREEILERIVRAASRLDRSLVTDLIEMERISSGAVTPVSLSTNIAEVAQTVVSASDPQHHEIILDAEPVTLDADPTKVERIIDNLVSNAVKHTPSGSRIWVRVREEGEGAHLIVEDEGPGVPPELRDRVFTVFARGPGAETSPGLGVGLSIVRRFAALHGGHVWVEERPGGGASFHVTLEGSASERQSDADRPA